MASVIRFALIFLAAAILPAQTAVPRFEAADVHRSARATNPYTLVSGGVLRGTR
jgi:hypothetical protein